MNLTLVEINVKILKVDSNLRGSEWRFSVKVILDA